MKKIYVLAFILIISGRAFSQVSSKSLLNSLSVTHLTNDKKIEIKLASFSDISNLLVVIANKDGKVMFLDNQYRIKGSYLITVNTEGYDKGKYTLNITADNEKDVKTFLVK